MPFNFGIPNEIQRRPKLTPAERVQRNIFREEFIGDVAFKALGELDESEHDLPSDRTTFSLDGRPVSTEQIRQPSRRTASIASLSAEILRSADQYYGHDGVLAKFNNLPDAQEEQAYSHELLNIVRGPDGKYWLCTPETAEQLREAGLEIVADMMGKEKPKPKPGPGYASRGSRTMNSASSRALAAAFRKAGYGQGSIHYLVTAAPPASTRAAVRLAVRGKRIHSSVILANMRRFSEPATAPLRADPNVQADLQRFLELRRKRDTLEAQVEDLDTEMSELQARLLPVLKDADGQMVRVGDVAFKYTKASRTTVSWKKAFQILLTKVNAQTRAVIEQTVADMSKTTEYENIKLDVARRQRSAGPLDFLKRLWNRMVSAWKGLVSFLSDAADELIALGPPPTDEEQTDTLASREAASALGARFLAQDYRYYREHRRTRPAAFHLNLS